MENQFSMDPGTEEISNTHLLCKEIMNLLWIYIWINPFQLHDVIYRFFNSIRVNIYWCLQPLKIGFKHILIPIEAVTQQKLTMLGLIPESFYIKSPEDPTQHMCICFQTIQPYWLISEHLPRKNSSLFTLAVSLLHFCGSCQWRWSKASVQIKKQLQTIPLITSELLAFIWHSLSQHVAVTQQNILSFLSHIIAICRNAPGSSVFKRFNFLVLCLKTTQLLKCKLLNNILPFCLC